jgi:hypothetical protein
MLLCQWHLDIIYGKQAEALGIMRATRSPISSARSPACLRRSFGLIPMPWPT